MTTKVLRAECPCCGRIDTLKLADGDDYICIVCDEVVEQSEALITLIAQHPPAITDLLSDAHTVSVARMAAPKHYPLTLKRYNAGKPVTVICGCGHWMTIQLETGYAFGDESFKLRVDRWQTRPCLDCALEAR